MRVGFIMGGQRERNEAELREFMANPIVEDLYVDADVSWHYAEIVVDLRRAGTPVPTNDIWIAATAARAGALVLTTDPHFNAISRVGAIVVDVGGQLEADKGQIARASARQARPL